MQQIIDEETGRMMNIPKDSLILEGAVCSGERSTGRWFCPRQIYPYWREAWLERVDEPVSDPSQTRSRGRSASEDSMPRVGSS